jgi:hypothetical protein
MGSDMLYDRNYAEVAFDEYTHEQYYRGNPKRRKETDILNSSEYENQYLKFDKVYPVDSQGLVQ